MIKLRSWKITIEFDGKTSTQYVNASTENMACFKAKKQAKILKPKWNRDNVVACEVLENLE